MTGDWLMKLVAEDCSEEEKDRSYRESVRCKIFLGFTSNLISSGVRDTIRYLVQHHMVDVIVTAAGGVEEDLIKCLAPTFKGDFSLPGAYLRSKGLNRIGNLLVPNDNYCKLETWILAIFDEMLKEQKEEHTVRNSRIEFSRLLWCFVDEYSSILPRVNRWLSWRYALLSPLSYLWPHSRCSARYHIRAINGEAVHATPRKTGWRGIAEAPHIQCQYDARITLCSSTPGKNLMGATQVHALMKQCLGVK